MSNLRRSNQASKCGPRTDFRAYPFTSAEHAVLAHAADAAHYSVCGVLAQNFGIAYINVFKYFKGEQRVPYDRATDVALELKVDPARICAVYRIDRERASRQVQDVHLQPEFVALKRAIKPFPGTLGDLCIDLGIELGVNKNRMKLWLTGKQEVPHSFAVPLAAYLNVHPAEISLQYLALHRFPRPDSEPPTTPIPTGPYVAGEWIAKRSSDPNYRTTKARVNFHSATSPHPLPSAQPNRDQQVDTPYVSIIDNSAPQPWPESALDITARSIRSMLKFDPTLAMEIMRDLLLTAGQEVYDKVSAKLTA